MAKAKARILDAALMLFNQQGSGAVSTNHIAKAAEISTGTLYYHYKNKEEIIRDLYLEMGEVWTSRIANLSDVTMESFEDLRNLGEALYNRYRFIHTELYALCQHDSTLAEMNRETLQQRKEQLRRLLEMLVERESYEALDDKTLDFLTDTVWMVILYWQPFQEMLQSDKPMLPFEAVDRLIRMHLVKPTGNMRTEEV